MNINIPYDLYAPFAMLSSFITAQMFDPPWRPSLSPPDKMLFSSSLSPTALSDEEIDLGTTWSLRDTADRALAVQGTHIGRGMCRVVDTHVIVQRDPEGYYRLLFWTSSWATVQANVYVHGQIMSLAIYQGGLLHTHYELVRQQISFLYYSP